jgi:hypothetical protein
MPRVKDSLRVEVQEETAGDVRTITVAITAPAETFLLTDLLRQRGAVGGVDAPLKQAVRDAVQGYLDGVEDLIAGVAAGQKKAGKQPRKTTAGVTEPGLENGAGGDVIESGAEQTLSHAQA